MLDFKGELHADAPLELLRGQEEDRCRSIGNNYASNCWLRNTKRASKGVPIYARDAGFGAICWHRRVDGIGPSV